MLHKDGTVHQFCARTVKISAPTLFKMEGKEWKCVWVCLIPIWFDISQRNEDRAEYLIDNNGSEAKSWHPWWFGASFVDSESVGVLIWQANENDSLRDICKLSFLVPFMSLLQLHVSKVVQVQQKNDVVQLKYREMKNTWNYFLLSSSSYLMVCTNFPSTSIMCCVGWCEPFTKWHLQRQFEVQRKQTQCVITF